MKASSFVYFLKEGIRNLWANRLMSVASIGILIACLLLMGNTVLLSLNLNDMITKIGNVNTIMVYINDGLTDDQVRDIGNKIKANPNISSVEFISKESALEKWKATLGDNANILEGIDRSNPLPDSYQLILKDLAKQKATVADINKIEGVASAKGRDDFADKLVNLRSKVNVMSLVVTAIMIIVSLFIIVNTIKLALYTRKREINIMKYVGATNWFIRWPFLFEGLYIGVLSGIVAYLLQAGMYRFVMSSFVGIMGNSKPIVFSHLAGFVFLCFMGTGIIVGAIGSIISIRKYLKA